MNLKLWEKLAKAVGLIKKSELAHILLLVAVALYPRIRYFFFNYYELAPKNGPIRAYDTEWYIEHARAFIQNFNVDMNVDGIFYFSYYSLLSILLLILKSEALIVFFQVIVNAVTVVLVYKICVLLFNRRTGIIAGLLYAYTWPVISWAMFIITDSFFISLLLLDAYFLLNYYKSNNRKYLFSFIICSVYMIFFRPTGIITLSFILVYILFNINLKSAAGIFKRWKILFISSGIVTAALVVFLLGSTKLAPLYESFSGYLDWLLVENYSKGQIFDVKTNYDYKFDAIMNVNYCNNFALSFFINNWDKILTLYAKRALFFWAFNIGHFTIYKIYFIIVYAFGLAGMVSIIKGKRFKRTSLLLLIILSIMFFCIFFFMDSAYRYRVPALVFANIYAAYGIDRTIGFTLKSYQRIKGLVS